ncbi:Uncharacterized protein TCAP_00250 [Tolypocladium capitatum]|uniref:Uncharacterized protein n=1 Tax=Tolypocladium capitatum TaxID=45235 RepID=A0A2K3QQM1_9HYPO|nr:Uncharacterized protein TCAP_00250 [Tolypocladium capitatum]
MSHHHDKKPLWLIQPRLDAAEYRDKLMGSVVKYPDLPTERRIPYRSLKMPKELVPDLDPKPIQVHNVKFWSRNIKDAKVSASVNELLEAFVERAREHSSDKVATVARLWHMDSPGEKFRELLGNKQYFEELFELLRSTNDQRGYFITDMVTLVNLEVSDSTGSATGAGAQVQVPVDPSTGIRVGAGARLQVSRENGYSASYEGETIVFLGYRLVLLEKVDGARARLRRVVLGQKHGFAVRDGFDYWPDLVDKPVEGNAEPFLGVQTPKAEEPPQLDEQLEQELADEDVVAELGFDVQVVG